MKRLARTGHFFSQCRTQAPRYTQLFAKYSVQKKPGDLDRLSREELEEYTLVLQKELFKRETSRQFIHQIEMGRQKALNDRLNELFKDFSKGKRDDKILTMFTILNERMKAQDLSIRALQMQQCKAAEALEDIKNQQDYHIVFNEETISDLYQLLHEQGWKLDTGRLLQNQQGEMLNASLYLQLYLLAMTIQR